jgi:hypothetical protein
MKKATSLMLQELGYRRLFELQREAGDSQIDIYLGGPKYQDYLITVNSNGVTFAEDKEGLGEMRVVEQWQL